MESCSENSFTWTDTSSDSSDNHSMAADDTELVKNNESVRRGTKRRIKEAASNNCNGTEDANKTIDETKLKKEKIISEILNDNNVKKKMVKVEPESDSDIPRKKKRIKDSQVNGNLNEMQDNASYDESYLNLKVKQEDLSTSSSAKTKKKKKHPILNDSDSKTEIIKQRESSDGCEENHSQNIDETNYVKPKKKKKKLKRRSNSEAQDDSDYKMDIEETFVSNKNNSRTAEISISENTFGDESGCDEISAIQCEEDHNPHTISLIDKSIEKEYKTNKDSLYKSTLTQQFKMDKNNMNHDTQMTSLTGEKRVPRISDRIRFEDEDEPGMELQVYENKDDNISLKLKKFIKNSNMKASSLELQDSSILTHDDEIWIVKCPKEIDVQALYHTDLNIQEKCKVKVDGQTYDSNLDHAQDDTPAVLSREHDKYQIRNLPLSGIINFRKKIPKPHFRDDNIMVNNQTNFIPLPETKCRHPLFGSNYKKSLRIPSAVAERLNAQSSVEETVSSTIRKKKKHKKNRSLIENKEIEAKSEVRLVKPEPDDIVAEPVIKKKKKRKHSNDEGPTSKKIKHDPESAEAWESEKAIEQNLFNF